MDVHLLRAFRLSYVVLTACLGLPACSTWRTVSISPQELFEREQPAAIRVHRADDARVVLRQPILHGDSLVGRVGPTETAVPLDQVRRIAVRRGNAWRTGGLIAGILALPFVVIGTACALDSECQIGS